MRIAMWSGPRNLSTAMMYAFAARGDCAVWDEPFYAPYLSYSGRDDPMRTSILTGHETDGGKVAERCLGPIPDNQPHFYMKHMPHHMAGQPLDWMEDCVNVYLVRHPARVISSYLQKRENPTEDDLGFRQQAELFARYPGPVLDSFAVRQNPSQALGALCAQIGLSWTDRMLSWQAGPRPYDGIWASHWYNAVHQSTGFAPTEDQLPCLDEKGQRLLDQTLPYYRFMLGS